MSALCDRCERQTRKRGERGGESDSELLGAYDRGMLNENGKQLLRFAEDFRIPENGASYKFQSAMCGEG